MRGCVWDTDAHGGPGGVRDLVDMGVWVRCVCEIRVYVGFRWTDLCVTGVEFLKRLSIHSFVDADVEDVGSAEDACDEPVVVVVVVVGVWRANAHGDGGGGETTTTNRCRCRCRCRDGWRRLVSMSTRSRGARVRGVVAWTRWVG